MRYARNRCMQLYVVVWNDVHSRVTKTPAMFSAPIESGLMTKYHCDIR